IIVLDPFVSFRLFEVNFGGYRKQKTHNFRYGFPFAEKEELQLIILNIDYQSFINFILAITHRITHLINSIYNSPRFICNRLLVQVVSLSHKNVLAFGVSLFFDIPKPFSLHPMGKFYQ
ncbi:hypothetical protein KO529_14405, partial [Arenibacter algicola]|uniref:hypothetical protein n=1 Tax=Arenibacter algicola TaxID=616991 RepID=UPI001C06FFD9